MGIGVAGRFLHEEMCEKLENAEMAFSGLKKPFPMCVCTCICCLPAQTIIVIIRNITFCANLEPVCHKKLFWENFAMNNLKYMHLLFVTLPIFMLLPLTHFQCWFFLSLCIPLSYLSLLLCIYSLIN